MQLINQLIKRCQVQRNAYKKATQALKAHETILIFSSILMSEKVQTEDRQSGGRN
jgi:hypothetical protein